MELLDQYQQTLDNIYNYFGFKEAWTVYPIDDRRSYYWCLSNDKLEVYFFDSLDEYNPEKLEDAKYSDEILYHRDHPKAIYEGLEYTLIMVDTNVDANKFLTIWDNKKNVHICVH
jgi:hypothetical protein